MFCIITKKDCPFCDKAKDLMARCGMVFEEIPQSSMDNASAFIQSHGRNTYPFIYQSVGDDYMNVHHVIGGYDELETMVFDSGLAS